MGFCPRPDGLSAPDTNACVGAHARGIIGIWSREPKGRIMDGATLTIIGTVLAVGSPSPGSSCARRLGSTRTGARSKPKLPRTGAHGRPRWTPSGPKCSAWPNAMRGKCAGSPNASRTPKAGSTNAGPPPTDRAAPGRSHPLLRHRFRTSRGLRAGLRPFPPWPLRGPRFREGAPGRSRYSLPSRHPGAPPNPSGRTAPASPGGRLPCRSCLPRSRSGRRQPGIPARRPGSVAEEHQRRSSRLSRGGAPGMLSGSSKAVCAVKRARPSSAESKHLSSMVRSSSRAGK